MVAATCSSSGSSRRTWNWAAVSAQDAGAPAGDHAAAIIAACSATTRGSVPAIAEMIASWRGLLSPPTVYTVPRVNGRSLSMGSGIKPEQGEVGGTSPFPAIEDYSFLSDCHTGALVAPDGAIDWLCIPRFDAPSVFGTLLDRQAGAFRFAPFGINVPLSRMYEPGTNTLVTTWKTPTGWTVVRDSLTIGPRRGEDLVTPHTRPPTDEDAEHLLVRVALCLEGEVEMELTCEPVFDYGRVPAQWSVDDGGHRADASGADTTIRLQTDLAVGVEGDWVR